jgi:hypothetical protein
MVWTLQFPDKPIPTLIQDLLKNNWPETPDVDPLKLQTTRTDIDFGHDFDDQTSQRTTIKAISLDAESTKSASEIHRSIKRQELGGTVVVRAQYRDADEEQPRELWNIGKEMQNLLFRHMFGLVNDGIHDIKPGRFRVLYEIPDHPELHEWHQNVFVFFNVVGADV